ncbi:MAG: hypothetical protein ACUVXA_00560 [Candidatus Jordarchaeum sp.]|uniref:hypothetical protein n=1 Tax=Candidatus Jordarchaeum sp. TaxID=2823881 RepID=UPI0040492C42
MVGKPCQPSCQFFQCGQKAIDRKKTNRGIEILCSWGGDTCVGAQCIYANCIRKKLKSDLTCGLEPPKPQQPRKIEPEVDIGPRDKLEKWSLDHIPIKGKTLKKIKALKYDMD